MRIEKQITINRPLQIVFAFLTDMTKVSLWTPVKRIRQVSSGPLSIAVGEMFLQDIEFMGQRFEVMTEVTDYQSPHLFGFKIVSGPLPLQSRFILSAVASGSHVMFISEGEPGSALKFAGPLVTSIAAKQLENQLSRLKSMIEVQ